MVETSVQNLPKDMTGCILLNGPKILIYSPLVSSNLVSLTILLRSKALQLVSSISVILLVFVVVINGCMCSKITTSIGPNIAQIFSYWGIPKERVPSKTLTYPSFLDCKSHTLRLQRSLLTLRPGRRMTWRSIALQLMSYMRKMLEVGSTSNRMSISVIEFYHEDISYYINLGVPLT